MIFKVAIFVTGVVWAFALLAVKAAAPLSGPAVIDITQTQIRQQGRLTRIDDDEFWVYQLYNRRAAIGYSLLRCERVGVGGPLGSDGVNECFAVYALAKGKIMAHGVMKRRSYYALAVTGGTGIYSNVGGQVLATTISSRPHEERLLFGLEVTDSRA